MSEINIAMQMIMTTRRRECKWFYEDGETLKVNIVHNCVNFIVNIVHNCVHVNVNIVDNCDNVNADIVHNCVNVHLKLG